MFAKRKATSGIRRPHFLCFGSSMPRSVHAAHMLRHMCCPCVIAGCCPDAGHGATCLHNHTTLNTPTTHTTHTMQHTQHIRTQHNTDNTQHTQHTQRAQRMPACGPLGLVAWLGLVACQRRADWPGSQAAPLSALHCSCATRIVDSQMQSALLSTLRTCQLVAPQPFAKVK